MLGLVTSPPRGRVATPAPHPGLAFVVGAVQDVGRLVRPGAFDAVVTVATLQRVPEADQSALLRDVARVLRPGGVFRVDMGGHGPLLELCGDLAGLLDELGAPRCPEFLPSAERARELLEGAGFAVGRCELVTRRRHLADDAAVRDWLVDQVLPARVRHVAPADRTAFAEAAASRVLAASRHPDGGIALDDVRLLATSFWTGTAAPHAFPGAAGDAADGLAETARRLSAARSLPELPEARHSLWHKRFEAAAAVARRDPGAARSMLDALQRDVAEGVGGLPPSP